MKEKIYVFVFCLIIGASIFAYDQHVVGKGGIGPISKAMRILGLDKNKKNPEIVKRGLELTFDYSVRKMYVDLQDELKQIHGQKAKLIEQRKRLLKRMVDVHDKMVDASLSYESQINEQRKPYLNYNSEIKQLSKDLIEAHKLSDSDLRLKRYKILEEQLMALIERSLDYPKDDVGRLKNIIYSIKQIVMQNDAFFIEGCDTFDQCLIKRRNEIDNQLMRIFEPALKKQGRQIEKYNELLDLSEYEYLLEFDNIDSRAELDGAGDREIYASVQGIMNQLIRITPNDLEDLIDVYKDIAIESNRQLRTFKDQQDRWQKNTKWNRTQLNEIVNEIGQSEEMDFQGLVTKFNELDKEYEEIINAIKVNSEQLTQIINHKLFLNQSFLFEVSKIMNIDINRLVKENAYAQGMNSVYLKMRHRMKKAGK